MPRFWVDEPQKTGASSPAFTALAEYRDHLLDGEILIVQVLHHQLFVLLGDCLDKQLPVFARSRPATSSGIGTTWLSPDWSSP